MFAEVFFNNKRYTALFNNLYKVILWQSDTFHISADTFIQCNHMYVYNSLQYYLNLNSQYYEYYAFNSIHFI